MAKSKSKSASAKTSRNSAKASKGAVAPKTSRRLWLSYPPEQIKHPVIWQMCQRFPIVFDIRQASVTDKIGIVCLELEGTSKDVEGAIAWLRKTGVRVEPVELSTLES